MFFHPKEDAMPIYDDDPDAFSVSAISNGHHLRELAELRKLVKERPKPKPADTPYLTTEEAAAYIRRSVQYLYNHRREIPRVRRGIYRKADLDTWLASRRRR